jgi:hypothetical protein
VWTGAPCFTDSFKPLELGFLAESKGLLPLNELGFLAESKGLLPLNELGWCGSSREGGVRRHSSRFPWVGRWCGSSREGGDELKTP